MIQMSNDVKCKRCKFYEGGTARKGNCKVIKKDVSRNEFCSLSDEQINAMNMRIQQMIADMMTGAGEEDELRL